MISTACPDWWQRILAGQAPVADGLVTNAAEADRGARIFDRLRLPDVIGRPTFGVAAGPWYREAVVRPLFGSLHSVTGRRRIHTVAIYVPKKNSKTTLTAGVSVTALLMNQRPNATFAQFGPTQTIAEQGYDAAVGIIEADAQLKQVLRTRDHIKTIEHLGSGASLQVTTFDPQVATGGIYAGAIIDEFHLLGSMAKADRVIGQIKGARVAVPEAFMIYTTTQSDEAPAGVFRSELDYARRVRDGEIIDEGYLPVMFEFPVEIQTDRAKPWLDPALWHLVNPNAGRSVSIETLRADFAKADAGGEHELRRWASQHLNIQIGVALGSDRWKGAGYWEGAAGPCRALNDLVDRCDVLVCGIDGGGIDDLMALTVIGRDSETRDWHVWAKAWVDPSLLVERPAIAPRLRDFERDGDLVIVEPNAQVEQLAEIVAQLHASGLLARENAIGVDAVGIGAVVDAIVAAGVPFELVKAVGQGFRLSGNIQTTSRRLAAGTLWHCDQALMAWAVGNVRIELKGNNLFATKQTAGAAKIDPFMAMMNAVDFMGRNPEAIASAAAEVEFL